MILRLSRYDEHTKLALPVAVQALTLACRIGDQSLYHAMKASTSARPDGVTCYASTRLPTRFGPLTVRVYRHGAGVEPVALIAGQIAGKSGVPVRVHSACFTSEAIGSLKCDCRDQLDYALHYIARHGGAVLYLQQEGRGIGLGDKIRAYALQEQGHDTIEANHLLGLPVDARTYDAAASMLRDLGVASIRLMTNNPDKLESLERLGVQVVGRIPIAIDANPHSRPYLETKRDRMGHWLSASGRDVLDGANEDSPESVSERYLEASRPGGDCLPRPLVHMNLAIGADGRIATARGTPAVISCAEDWRRVHELREKYAAVAVGAHTWQLDRPRLSARAEHLGRRPLRQPARIVFAGSQRCAIQSDGRRTFVIGCAPSVRAEHTISIECPDHDLAVPLRTLRDDYRIESLLVEGGPTLLGSFVSQGHVDIITIYVRTTDFVEAERIARTLLAGLPNFMAVERFGQGVLLSSSSLA